MSSAIAAYIGGAGIALAAVLLRGWLRRSGEAREQARRVAAAHEAHVDASIKHAESLAVAEKARAQISDASADETAALINEVFK